MVQGYGSTEGWVVTSWHPMMGKRKDVFCRKKP